jgi:hypothetical protein
MSIYQVLAAVRGMLIAVLAGAALSATAASIVQITSGPQDAPHDLSLLTLTPPPGPLGAPQDPGNFALHDHVYLSPQFPDPASAYVLFEFDQAVVVDSMMVVQHTNGVTFLQHSYGDVAGSLATGSLSMSATYGDASGDGVMTEFTNDPFVFADGGSGRFHQFVVQKTSNPGGWATYRFYLDYHAAAIPEAGTAPLFMLGLLALGLAARRRL